MLDTYPDTSEDEAYEEYVLQLYESSCHQMINLLRTFPPISPDQLVVVENEMGFERPVVRCKRDSDGELCDPMGVCLETTVGVPLASEQILTPGVTDEMVDAFGTYWDMPNEDPLEWACQVLDEIWGETS